MFIDYTDQVETVVAVAQAMLVHAGDVELIEDDDGRLLLRLPVAVAFSPRYKRELAVEVDEFERKDWPTPPDSPDNCRLVPRAKGEDYDG